MPWRVGLDEAGYGPNLGPLVVSSTACRVPADAPPCLWKLLARAVRKARHKDDGRLLIDDSKKVNDGPTGLAKLEAGVLSVLTYASPACAEREVGPGCMSAAEVDPPSTGSVEAQGGDDTADVSLTLRGYLAAVAVGGCVEDISAEPWYLPDDPLPTANPPEAVAEVRTALIRASDAGGLTWGPVRSVAIPAPEFNRLLDEWRLKSGVLATGVIALLNATLELPGDEAIHITVDKLGGRHFYAPLLNEAFPGGWVRVIRETPARCDYAIDGIGREVHLRFEPRADGNHLNVALASMAAKYLREVCMQQFNRHWVAKVPGLKPTAGYPTDAGRFFDAIRGTLAADGIDKRAVWRDR